MILYDAYYDEILEIDKLWLKFSLTYTTGQNKLYQ